MRGATPPVESECVFVTVRAGVSCGVGCFGAPLWGRWLDGEVSGSVVRPRQVVRACEERLVSAPRVERAPLVRSALADFRWLECCLLLTGLGRTVTSTRMFLGFGVLLARGFALLCVRERDRV